MPKCCGCGDKFRSNETQYLSGIYGCANIYLCKFCHEIEEKQMDDYGTNDIEHLRRLYIVNEKLNTVGS